jgi:RNA recognition motif-containing protein
MIPMSADYQPRSSGSRGRRSRRYGGRRDSSRRESSNRIEKKEGFFDKILGWFGKKKTPAFKPKQEGGQFNGTRNKPSQTESVPQEVTSPKLYVGNLSYDTAESDLFDLFSKVGAVKNVEIVMERQSNRSKGFGFVEMESLDSAKGAVAQYNRTEFMGRQIVVSGAKTDRR